MADDIQRLKQYDYNANSNLVLQSDRSRKRDPNEGTGEVGPLAVGQLPGKMGDRATEKKSEDFDDRVEKRKKKRSRSPQESTEGMVKKKRPGGDLRSTTNEIDEGYRPRTKASKIAYEHILSFMQEKLGDQPRDLLRNAAEEAIAVLKTDQHKDSERKKDVEEALGEKFSKDEFARLSTYTRQITDFETEMERKEPAKEMEEDAGQNAVDEFGVAVVFDEEGEEDESELDEIVEEDAEDADEGEDTRTDLFLTGDVENEGEELEKSSRKLELDPRDIDGYWLQRQLGRYYDDAVKSKEIAEQVMSILSAGTDERDGENDLVILLDYDKFDFIKVLLKNRLTIVYCIKYARAQTSEKAAVEEEMMANPEGAALLAVLKSDSEAVANNGNVVSMEGVTSAAPVDKARRSNRKQKLEQTAPVLKAEKMDGVASGALQEPRKLDLESLTFSQGSHIMSNKKVELPKGSFEITKKDYEEWHIPAMKATNAGTAKLKPISSMPGWTQSAFKMKTFNRMQTQVYDAVFESDENILLCAPTGAGKTNVAVLSILRVLGKARLADDSFDLSSFKVVYIAPMKALVAEVVLNLGERLKSLGMTVAELTGDVNMTKQEVHETQVIVTTPEKWDIITRKSGERTFTELVRLLIVDEIHLLHDERGPVLEAVIARTTRAVESTSMETRVIGLSATLPNYKDIAAFLRVSPDKGLFHFDATYRPCPLEQQYLGITSKKALKRFQLMNELCWEKVKEQTTGPGGSQVIIFVHSRKETGNTARQLRDMAIENSVLDDFMEPESASYEIVMSDIDTVKSKELPDLLKHGFGIHHAGMARSDRKLVEELFASGNIKVLVSTATLAWGVNLPAHAVIIKGTQVYSPEKGRWTELSAMDIMQMMGRAGRPQFDTHGEGIIITTHAELQFYRSLLNQQLPIESQMISRLPDCLNAEITLGTVSNVSEASIWLGYTYLYVRMVQNPTLYGISLETIEEDPTLEQMRLDLVHSAALILDKAGLIRYDRRSGQLQGTDLGRVSSYYYVSHKTMSVFAEHLKPTLSEIDLFRLFSLSGEFEHMSVREEEKIELSRLLERVPIPVKDSIDQTTAKVTVLLQAYISNLKLDGLALTSDMVYITQSAGRIMRAIFEIVLRRKWAFLADRCLALCKMIQRRQWTSQTPLRQFVRALPGDGLTEEVLKRMERKDIEFESYYDLSPAEIGEHLRNARMGKIVHRQVHYLPKLDIEAHIQPITRSTLRVELIITPDFDFSPKVHGAGEPFWIFVEDSDGETLLHHESFYLRASVASEEHSVTFTVPISEPLPPQYFVKCISDRWITPDTVIPISFRHLILPEKFPPHTELLDMQPLQTKDAFRNSGGETEDAEDALRDYFVSKFAVFNPIQTQLFNAFYRSEANCLLAAPSGSGRMVMAEIAIGQLFVQKPAATAVYVAAQGETSVPRRVAEFKKGIANTLDLIVSTLTGETAADLRVLDTPGTLVVSTPEQWDNLSRRWKQRRAVRSVALFIVDDLHYVGGRKGPVTEVICLRMRYMSVKAADAGRKPCRIVALSDPVANARDLAAWLGVPSQNMFSFHPNSRPLPLETHIQTVPFTGSNIVSTMARPVYNAIRAADPVVIFVASRKLVRATAFELITSAAGDGKPNRFLHASEGDIAPLLDKVKTSVLRRCLAAGVGYIHESIAASDRAIVEQLYLSGAVQVVVATVKSAWISAALYGRLIIIAGTAEEESTNALHRSEYPLPEILHIMGRAGRPQEDTSGVCVVLTNPSQREHYRKFLGEPLPVESHLDHVLADQLNAEIVAKVIETKQDALDYMTWTLFYRRLPQNPNYYRMFGTSHRHISEHLSELVETSLEDLEKCRCVAAEGDLDMALGPLNLGMIASYYYIKYNTIELFASTVTPNTKTRGLLEVLSAAVEYNDVPVRLGDDDALRKIGAHVPINLGTSAEPVRYSDPHVKTHLLLQTHFSRQSIAGELREDRDAVVGDALRLVQAMVDVTSSAGWLKPAIAAMELSQMIVQALWDRDPTVMQLPHIDSEKAEELSKLSVTSVFDLIDMDDDMRIKALNLSTAKYAEVAAACNRYPNIEMEFELSENEVSAGDQVLMNVMLTRDTEEEMETQATSKKAPTVHAPFYPRRKEESWWLVIGDTRTSTLLSVKRVPLGTTANVKLEFEAPEGDTVMEHKLKLYLMSDSYLGCDQENDFVLKVLPSTSE